MIGIGSFNTVTGPRSPDTGPKINYWTGKERFFRFSSDFRLSLDRWQRLPPGITPNIARYIPGKPELYTPQQSTAVTASNQTNRKSKNAKGPKR